MSLGDGKFASVGNGWMYLAAKQRQSGLGDIGTHSAKT